MCDPRRTIRPYTNDDLDDVLDAWYLASQQAHPFLDEDFFDTERTLTSDQFLPASETWVFEIHGRVVGSISLLDNEVGGIFVTPAHQNQGIGRALMDHVAATRPHLELEVFEANAIGRRFYDAYGFLPVSGGFDEATGQPMIRLRIESAAS